jgi:hypothetical protein
MPIEVLDDYIEYWVMDFQRSAGKHPPAEDDEAVNHRPPVLKEPEPDTPEPDPTKRTTAWIRAFKCEHNRGH